MTAERVRTITDDPTRGSTYRETVERLASAQKSRRGGPPYSIYVNRPLGRRTAAVGHLLGMRPNQVTVVSAAFSFAGIALLALGPSNWLTGVVVMVSLVVGYALDAADGQLARLRGGGSVAGEWLDHMVDAAKIVSLHSAVLVHFHRNDDVDGAWLLVPLGFSIVAVTLFFAQLLNEQLRRGRAVPEAPVAPSVPAGGSSVMALVKLPHDYGFLCLSFVLLGAPVAFFGLYSFMLAFNAAYLALASFKWFAEMVRLDSGGTP